MLVPGPVAQIQSDSAVQAKFTQVPPKHVSAGAKHSLAPTHPVRKQAYGGSTGVTGGEPPGPVGVSVFVPGPGPQIQFPEAVQAEFLQVPPEHTNAGL